MANWPLIWVSPPFKQIFKSSDVVKIDTFLTKVPNFLDGSDHTLGAGQQVILRGGDGLKVTSQVVIPSGATLSVPSGGAIAAAAGSDVDFLEPIRVAGLNNNGSAITVTDNLTVNATIDGDKVVDGLNVPATHAFASNVALDFGVSVNHEIGAMTSNMTVTFSNVPIGRMLTVFVAQDGTGGRTITWPTIFFGAFAAQPASGGFEATYYVFYKTSTGVIACLSRNSP